MMPFSKLPFSTHQSYYLGIGIVCSLLTIYSLHIPFFWDNVYLVSKMTHYYYENAFPSVVLPLELDSGHPPFYALYMAVVWSVFGKTLAVSHWTVFPFLLTLGIAYYHLARYFLPFKAVPYALFLLLIEPTLLAQSLLGGVDIALLALYLMALNGIFYQKRSTLAISLCLMSAFSLRGIIAVGLLGLTEFLWEIGSKQEWKKNNSTRVLQQREKTQSKPILVHLFAILKRIVPAYLPAVFLVLIWLVYHYEINGFLASNPDSPWAGDYGYVDFKGWIWNLGIITWRLLDYGRIVVWGLTVFLLLQWWLKRNHTIAEPSKSSNSPAISSDHPSMSKLSILLTFTILPMIFYLPFISFRQTPILHRYFLPTIVLGSLIFIAVWFVIQSKKTKNCLFIAVVFSLLSGHFWVYPDGIAKGWDASLAYLPYFELNDQVIAYLEAEGISFEAVGAEFPSVNPRKFTHLEAEDLRHFIDKDAYELTDFKYILQSNLMNDFSEQDLEELQSKEGNWRLQKSFEKGQVYIRLYVLK